MSTRGATQQNKRRSIDLKLRQEIIDKYNSGIRPKELAIFYNMAPSTVGTIVSVKHQQKLQKHLRYESKRAKIIVIKIFIK